MSTNNQAPKNSTRTQRREHEATVGDITDAIEKAANKVYAAKSKQDNITIWVNTVALFLTAASLIFNIWVTNQSNTKYESENRSYIQVGNFDTLSFNKQNMVVIETYYNLAKNPAKIITSFAACIFDRGGITDTAFLFRDWNAAHRNNLPWDPSPEYIIKEAPIPKRIQLTDATVKILPDDRAELLNGTDHVYYFGKVLYVDLLTNKKKLYSYCVDFAIPQKGFRFLYNVDVPDDYKTP